MSWRKHDSHIEETKAVKKALEEAGIKAKVGHGKGTAWAWLLVNIGPDPNPAPMEGGFGVHGTIHGVRCTSKEHKEKYDKALKIAQEVTGRHGDYHGEINILSQ